MPRPPSKIFPRRSGVEKGRRHRRPASLADAPGSAGVVLGDIFDDRDILRGRQFGAAQRTRQQQTEEPALGQCRDDRSWEFTPRFDRISGPVEAGTQIARDRDKVGLAPGGLRRVRQASTSWQFHSASPTDINAVCGKRKNRRPTTSGAARPTATGRRGEIGDARIGIARTLAMVWTAAGPEKEQAGGGGEYGVRRHGQCSPARILEPGRRPALGRARRLCRAAGAAGQRSAAGALGCGAGPAGARGRLRHRGGDRAIGEERWVRRAKCWAPTSRRRCWKRRAGASPRAGSRM